MVTDHGSISFSKGYTATAPLRDESDFNGNPDSRAQLFKAAADVNHFEGSYQILLVLCVMAPSEIMNGYNFGAGKQRCRFYGIVRIHGDVKRSAGLRCPGKEDGKTNIKSACYLRKGGKPNRISGNIHVL